MREINIPLLKAKIVENELTQEELVKRAGITKSTFYLRLKGEGEDFTTSEISKIAKVLSLEKEDIFKIFFKK